MKKKSQYKEGNFGAIYKFDHGYLCNLTKFSDCQDKPCRGGRALVWLGQCIRLGARSGGCPKALTPSNRASTFAEQNIGPARRRLPTKCPQPGSAQRLRLRAHMLLFRFCRNGVRLLGLPDRPIWRSRWRGIPGLRGP